MIIQPQLISPFRKLFINKQILIESLEKQCIILYIILFNLTFQIFFNSLHIFMMVMLDYTNSLLKRLFHFLFIILLLLIMIVSLSFIVNIVNTIIMALQTFLKISSYLLCLPNIKFSLLVKGFVSDTNWILGVWINTSIWSCKLLVNIVFLQRLLHPQHSISKKLIVYFFGMINIIIKMRQVRKKKLKKAYRIWNSKTKSFKSKFRLIKTLQGLNQQFHHCPCKLINIEMPQIKLPRKLEVYIGPKIQIDYSGQNILIQMSFDQFLKYKGPLFLSVVQMQIDQYSVPQFVSKRLKNIKKVNLWIYRGKRITNWHYDGHDNFLFMKKGTKTLYLLPPNTVRSKSSFSLHNNHINSKSSIKHFRNNIFKVKINENQCVYIPRGWWHYVVSEGQTNVAVNFWGNSIGEIQQGEYELIMRYLIYQISQKSCIKEIKDWENLQQQTKQKYRALNFARFFKEKLS